MSKLIDLGFTPLSQATPHILRSICATYLPDIREYKVGGWISCLVLHPPAGLLDQRYGSVKGSQIGQLRSPVHDLGLSGQICP